MGVGGDGGASGHSPHTHHLYVVPLGIFKQLSAGFQRHSELEAQAAPGVGVIGGNAQNHPEETRSTSAGGAMPHPPPRPRPSLL